MQILGAVLSAAMLAGTTTAGAQLAVSQMKITAGQSAMAEAQRVTKSLEFALADGVIPPVQFNERCTAVLGDFDATTYSRTSEVTCTKGGQERTLNSIIPCPSCSGEQPVKETT